MWNRPRTRKCPLGSLGTSRCSSWSQPLLFPQLLPHSVSRIEPCQLDPQLYPEITPPLSLIIRAPYHFLLGHVTAQTMTQVLKIRIWHVSSCSSEPTLSPHIQGCGIQCKGLDFQSDNPGFKSWCGPHLLCGLTRLHTSPTTVFSTAPGPSPLGGMPGSFRPPCLVMPLFVITSIPSSRATHSISPGSVCTHIRPRTPCPQLQHHCPTYFTGQAAEVHRGRLEVPQSHSGATLFPGNHASAPRLPREAQVPGPPGPPSHTHPPVTPEPSQHYSCSPSAVLFSCKFNISTREVPQGTAVLSLTFPAVPTVTRTDYGA